MWCYPVTILISRCSDQPDLHSFPTRRSSDLSIKLIQASAVLDLTEDDFDFLTSNKVWIKIEIIFGRSEERFSRNAETDLVCRLLLEKKKWPVKARRRAAPMRVPDGGASGTGR